MSTERGGLTSERHLDENRMRVIEKVPGCLPSVLAVRLALDGLSGPG